MVRRCWSRDWGREFTYVRMREKRTRMRVLVMSFDMGAKTC